MKTSFQIFILCALFSASLRSETVIAVAPAFLHFDYTEYNTSNRVLDRETGWIPGLQLVGNTKITEYLRMEFSAATYHGAVDYTGHTNKGRAHETRTDETLTHAGARLTGRLTAQTNLFLGMQFREWRRDIRDNNGVFGLFEIYRWQELSAGAEAVLLTNSTQQWRVEVSGLKVINPELFVDLGRVNAGTANLRLGEEFGSRFKLTWIYFLSDPWAMNVNAYVELWDFGRSDLQRTSNGATLVSEPRSETRNAGVQLAVQYTF